MITSHGLMLYNENEKSNNVKLLCACKKYNEDQKSGILLVDINTDENNENFNHIFMIQMILKFIVFATFQM